MKSDKQKRKEVVEQVKVSLAKDLDVSLTECYKVEAPAISIELLPFKMEDIRDTMPGRHWDHVGLKMTELVLADILNHIVNYGVIVHACCAAAVSYRQFGDLCTEYPAFKALKDEAKDLYRDKVSRAVHNRAIDGWLEPVFYKGCLIGHVRKFSDRMLELMAKKVDPGFRDKAALDLNVAGGVLVVSQGDVPDKEQWLDKMRGRRQIDSDIVAEQDGGE